VQHAGQPLHAARLLDQLTGHRHEIRTAGLTAAAQQTTE